MQTLQPQNKQQTTKKYIGVGFRLDKDHSIFYIKENNIDTFYQKLLIATINHKPHFISIRIVNQQ